MAEIGTQVAVCTVTLGAKEGDSEGAGENPELEEELGV